MDSTGPPFYKKIYLSGKNLFEEAVKSQTLQTSIRVTPLNLLTSAIGFASLVLLSRGLGPENYGTFAAVTSLMSIIAGFTDLGMTAALSRFVPRLKTARGNKADKFINVVFRIEIILGLAILVLGFTLKDFISATVFSGNVPVNLVMLGILGAFGVSMSAYVSAVFQGLQKFISLSLYGLAHAAAKFLLVLSLFVFNELKSLSAVMVYSLVPVVLFFVGLLNLPRSGRTFNFSVSEETFKELFNFSKWVMLSFFATSLIGRIDIVLLTHFRTTKEVGVYSAAFQLATIVPILISSLSAIILPRASEFGDKKVLKKFVKKVALLSLFLILVLSPGLVLADFFVPLVFGDKYILSIEPFRIIYLGFLVALFVNPMSLILYALDKAYALTLLNYIQLITIFFVGVALIPT